MTALRIRRVKQDCWIGLYWKTETLGLEQAKLHHTTWYLCLVPCFPIIWETYSK
jgi:hypothetical protein